MYYLVTWLTLSRIAAVPVIMALWLVPEEPFYFAITPLFFVLAATDFLDGALARKFNVTSTFGAFLDPLADKLLSTTLTLLMAFSHVLNPALLLALFLRDMLADACHSWVIRQGNVQPANKAGKIKLIFQWGMLACALLNAMHPALQLIPLAHVLGGIALIWGVFSLPGYLKPVFLKP